MQGCVPSRPLSLACRWLSSACVLILSSLYACLFPDLLFFFNLFIILERERVRESTGGGGEGEERESQADPPLSTEPGTGLNITTLRS